MAYIGNQIRQYSDRVVLDSLTASATANYTLQLNGSNYVPSSAESLTVSLNGVIQKPQNSYTVSGSTLSFASALTASDSIDFVIAERGITLQTPSAGSVNTEQLASNAVTTAKIADANVTSAKISYPLTTFSSTGIDDNATTNAITIESTERVQFTRPRSNTLGDSALEIKPSDTVIGYGFRIDQATNSLIIEKSSPSGFEAEYMRISGAGNVGIGTTSPSTHKLQVTGEFTGASAGVALFQNTHSTVASGDEVVRIQFSGDNDATGGHFINFYDSGGDIGRINVASASTTQYATTSDYRLKENIIDLENAIANLKLLRPRNFNFIKNPNVSMDGFIAHELQEVVPLAVDGAKDQMRTVKDVNGNDVQEIYPQAVDASKLIPILTKALQEAIERIETLEARITVLENK